MTPPEQREPAVIRGRLPLPPVIDALERWRLEPSSGAGDAVGRAVADMAAGMGIAPVRLRLSAPPLPDLDLPLGNEDGTGTEFLLRPTPDAAPLGSIWLSGDPEATETMAHALELAVRATQSAMAADRSRRQVAALDAAVRGIGGVLDLDRVLQLITDRVRDLVDARYAALGIVDDEGRIERFITSGISEAERARIPHLPRGHGLLGLIIRENRTYRIRDIAAHPQRYGFPPGHPEMHSFLGTPVLSRGTPVGRLYLTEKIGATEFSEDDQEKVEIFAHHAGIAIENARLHDQVRRLAVVDERERISRDLHDSVIQAIYAQTLALDEAVELVGGDPDGARQRVDEAIDALNGVIRDIRNFIFGLRPVLLENGGLADGLAQLAAELRRNAGVEVTLDVDERGRNADLPIETVAELLAVTREALSNVARHARATHASVRLTEDARVRWRLEIGDDGIGFDASADPGGGHHGLANMAARMRAASGTFEVDSAPGAGTRIIVTVPHRVGGDASEDG
ncbi:MAG TPA: GAF domain-containing sensor histidine kinase [Candidatus Limnocylindria bacterium]|nr:GAF domain-containing sensor histidine kinase [Candidatus Limnocylindria bacterium]